MTKFDALKGQFSQALKRLEEILKEEKTVIVRDAALKRFEFVFDLAWKAARAYLKERKGIDAAAPKDCFREAYRQGLIDYDEIWITMCDWRNEIVHAYGEAYAEKLFHRLPQVFAACQKLAQALEK